METAIALAVGAGRYKICPKPTKSDEYMMKKSFLFLQGPASPFFRKLGEELLDNGHRVLKINFNAADRFFWNDEYTACYKHGLPEFANYINDVAKLRKVTDLVLFNDDKPYHRAAIEALRHQKIRIHVFDEGYFGEGWVTLEDRIFGDKTLLPRDPRFYMRNNVEAASHSDVKGGKLMFHLQYWLSALLLGKTGYSPFKLRTILRKKIKQRNAQLRLANIRYFLADYDLSKKSSLIRSFANNADKTDMLVFWNKGRVSREQVAKTAEIAEKYDIAKRVVVLDEAAFRPLVKAAKGYITNHSINAIIALQKGKPVMALSNAIYNISGLTVQGDIHDFWQHPQTPDMDLFRKFRAYVTSRTQLSGSFYNRRGIEMAIDNSVRKILGRDGESASALQLA